MELTGRIIAVSHEGQDILWQSQCILTFLSDTFFRLVFKIIVKIIWKLLIFFLSLQREGWNGRESHDVGTENGWYTRMSGFESYHLPGLHREDDSRESHVTLGSGHFETVTKYPDPTVTLYVTLWYHTVLKKHKRGSTALSSTEKILYLQKL